MCCNPVKNTFESFDLSGGVADFVPKVPGLEYSFGCSAVFLILTTTRLWLSDSDSNYTSISYIRLYIIQIFMKYHIISP